MIKFNASKRLLTDFANDKHTNGIMAKCKDK